MKQSVLLVFIVLLLCNWKKSKSETDFIPVENNEIPAIIKTVILQDSLDVLQTKNGVRMLCEDLIRVNIYFIPERKEGVSDLTPPPPSITSIAFHNLMYSKIYSDVFFSLKDSLFLLKQNLNPSKLKISNLIDEEINRTS